MATNTTSLCQKDVRKLKLSSKTEKEILDKHMLVHTMETGTYSEHLVRIIRSILEGQTSDQHHPFNSNFLSHKDK